MRNSETLLKQRFNFSSRSIVGGILIVSLLGFLDATYLTTKHYVGGPVPCSFLSGCETVLTSDYATIAGIPVALFGALYYAFILILAIAYLEFRKEKALFVLARVPVTGFLASIWFVYLQIFVLKSLCLYCLFSALSSTILFLAGTILFFREKNIDASRRDQS